MLEPDFIPPVDSKEILSRYILTRRHVNQQTQQLKPDAFIPHPHAELSVTRDREATEQEIWAVGSNVAVQRDKPLIGRGDVLALSYLKQKLQTVPDPIESNPNHVNVSGWPRDNKAAQKLIAQEIAAVATFLRTPEQPDLLREE